MDLKTVKLLKTAMHDHTIRMRSEKGIQSIRLNNRLRFPKYNLWVGRRGNKKNGLNGWGNGFHPSVISESSILLCTFFLLPSCLCFWKSWSGQCMYLYNSY
ncbi:hypothetical protein BDV32DRAFT_111205 [Aspergillus pseudonomiae]|nr:hypothetical protein BDV32DRAFT_111205 [Aspergillus pseudonomiae]